MKKVIIVLMLLAVATTARAFSFSAAAPTGQTLYFDITSATTVAVVLPGDGEWGSYPKPTGRLEIPATVIHGGTTYSVTAIDQRAFRECSALTHVVVPEGVKVIGTLAFFLCSALDTVDLPSTIDSIASQAFNNSGLYNNLANWQDSLALYVGDYLVSVRNSASGHIIVRDGTQGIGGSGMYYCNGVSRVTLPATLRFIGAMAFRECAALDTVELLGTVPPTLAADAFAGVPHPTALVPCHAADAYRTAGAWSAVTIVEADCGDDTNGITLAAAEPLLTAVPGGIAIACPAGTRVTVADMMGRATTFTADGTTHFVALPASGVYVVHAESMAPKKLFYLK